MKQAYSKQHHSQPTRTNYKQQQHPDHLHNREKLSPFTVMYQRLSIFYQSRRSSARLLMLALLSFLFLGIRCLQIYPLSLYYSHEPTAPNLYRDFPPSPRILKQLNDYLATLSLEKRLHYLVDQPSYQDVIFVTSFGPTGMVLLDTMAKTNLLYQFTVVTIDTLYLFPETYEFHKTVQEHYPQLNLRVYWPHIPGHFPPTTREDFELQFGSDLYRTNPDEFAYHSKIQPLQFVLDQLRVKVWLTARRRDQGDERRQLPFVELEQGENYEDHVRRTNDDYYYRQRLKVNLMADWTYEQVWDYLRQNNVPYNPLHDRGYKSIGDIMTTHAVSSTAAERSGRFFGSNQTEYGMHYRLEQLESSQHEPLPNVTCSYCDYELTFDSFSHFTWARHIDIVLLLEFYSPLCDACQDFAPTMEQVVQQLKHDPATYSKMKEIIVARLDISGEYATEAMEKIGFVVEKAPTLYWLWQQQDEPPIILYTGELVTNDILHWIRSNLSE